VFGVDECRRAAQLLHLGDGLQRQGGFTGRLRAVDFDNPAARQTADTQRNIQRQRAG